MFCLFCALPFILYLHGIGRPPGRLVRGQGPPAAGTFLKFLRRQDGKAVGAEADDGHRSGQRHRPAAPAPGGGGRAPAIAPCRGRRHSRSPAWAGWARGLGPVDAARAGGDEGSWRPAPLAGAAPAASRRGCRRRAGARHAARRAGRSVAGRGGHRGRRGPPASGRGRLPHCFCFCECANGKKLFHHFFHFFSKTTMVGSLYPTVARNPPAEGGALPANVPSGGGGGSGSAGPAASSTAPLFPVLCVRVAPRLALTPGVLLPHEAGGHEVAPAGFEFDDSVERKVREREREREGGHSPATVRAHPPQKGKPALAPYHHRPIFLTPRTPRLSVPPLCPPHTQDPGSRGRARPQLDGGRRGRGGRGDGAGPASAAAAAAAARPLAPAGGPRRVLRLGRRRLVRPGGRVPGGGRVGHGAGGAGAGKGRRRGEREREEREGARTRAPATAPCTTH